MRAENKIALSDIHEQLNIRAGEIVPNARFEDLLWCWRRYVHKTRAGKDGWLSHKNATNFLNYAYHLG